MMESHMICLFCRHAYEDIYGLICNDMGSRDFLKAKRYTDFCIHFEKKIRDNVELYDSKKYINDVFGYDKEV